VRLDWGRSSINKQELIRWDSECELIYDDVVHAEASAYAHWTDFLISKDVRVPASLYYAGLITGYSQAEPA